MSQRMDLQEEKQKAIEHVASVVTKLAGIQLGPKQFSMVENRLKTRMLKLGVPTFNAYIQYLQKNTESESQALLSLLTTHHTYFFREFSHFEFLLQQGLPALIAAARKRPDKTVRIWSAAASRGQEAYSLAMFFKVHLNQMAPDVRFSITGTDVDPASIAHAKNGVYRYEELKQVPAIYAKDSWVRGRGNVADFAKMSDSLKRQCHFAAANLLDLSSFLKDKQFDVIFCRNVFIYFNQDQIRGCTENFLKHLDPAGFLFLGVSESLNGTGLRLASPAPSVYSPAAPARTAATPVTATKAPVAEVTAPLRILCVDDSPVILALMKKIFTKEHGFEVAGTAVNGKEALDLIAKEKFDAITLDLHMPVLDGIGFLQQSNANSRPPVLILSAIDRDEKGPGQQGLQLGAFDYVEKPSLQRIEQAGNEIRAKIKLAMLATKAETKAPAPAVKAQPKKVLIVDDSATIRQLLAKIIATDPGLQVVAEAERPSQVEDLIRKHKPDIITLDIHMPEMDGVTLLKKIFPIFKIPVVVISSLSMEEGSQVLEALETGAVDYIQKPSFKELKALEAEICDRIKTAAAANIRQRRMPARKVVSKGGGNAETIVLMGASTGGTEALRVVLESLPAQIPPTVIVQHIPPVFSQAFAQRLNQLCSFEVREAKDGDEVKANLVLIAPGGKQTGLVRRGGRLFVQVSDAPPVNRHKPSVDFLFESAANLNLESVIGVILTGMGADGAKMLKRLRDQGARTIGQDEKTSIVYGMPREAAQIGAVEFVKPIDDVAETLQKILNEKPNSQVTPQKLKAVS